MYSQSLWKTYSDFCVSECIEVLSDINTRPWFYMASKNITIIVWVVGIYCQDKRRKKWAIINWAFTVYFVPVAAYRCFLSKLWWWSFDIDIIISILPIRKETQRTFSTCLSTLSWEWRGWEWKWGSVPPDPMLVTSKSHVIAVIQSLNRVWLFAASWTHGL